MATSIEKNDSSESQLQTPQSNPHRVTTRQLLSQSRDVFKTSDTGASQANDKKLSVPPIHEVAARTNSSSSKPSELAAATSTLTKDVANLKHTAGNGKDNSQLQCKLAGDETDLHRAIQDAMAGAPTAKDFIDQMNSVHSQLKMDAHDLYDMGFKQIAGQTTSYYTNMEREYAGDHPKPSSPGTPPENPSQGGTPPESSGTGSGTGGAAPPESGTGSGTGGAAPPESGTGSGTGGAAPPESGTGSAASPPEAPQPVTPPGTIPTPITGQGPAGSTGYSGLDNAGNEKPDTKPGDIGGNGGITSINATQAGANAINFSMTGAGWGDGLWLTSVKTPLTEQNKNFNIQLNSSFSLTASQLANDHEIEKDIVGPMGVAGTQINPQTGEVDFWNAAASKWVNVGNLGPLQAGKNYNLQINIATNGNPDSGTYTFENYSLNGQAVNASQRTFNDKNLGWAPGLYIQTQLDLPGNPSGAAGMTETGQTLYVS